MKKLIVMMLVVVLGGLGKVCAAQTGNKVGVVVVGSIEESYKRIIGSKMVAQITKSPSYAAVERTVEFMNAIKQEDDYRALDAVGDNQIASIGRQLGVNFVAVANAFETFDEVYLDARLINVETGEVIAQTDGHSPLDSMSQLISLAEEVASGLTVVSVASVSSLPAGGGGGAVETFTVNGVSFDMVRVEGGSFMMGSTSTVADSDEAPVHTESVATFYIGRTEVTQALWLAVMDSNPSDFRGESLPVENVTWFECQEFVDRLSRLTGRMFRLPSEAEWEYAARGGNKSRGYKYSGGNDLYRVGWYKENSGGVPRPVATKLSNELDIYDMSGNVWEWTSDLYSNNYNASRNGGSSKSSRVFRGGSWGNSDGSCRLSNRQNYLPTNRNNSIGLRLAL